MRTSLQDNWIDQVDESGKTEFVPVPRAAVMANAAGALCVSKAGAQDSMPNRDEVDELVRRGRLPHT